MKQLLVLLLISILSFTILSCNNDEPKESEKSEQVKKEQTTNTPEDDAKIMFALMEEHSNIAKRAASDKKLNEREIQTLNKISKDISNFEKKIDKKYQKDKEGGKEIEKYIKDNQDEITILFEEYLETLLNLSNCEGTDMLK